MRFGVALLLEIEFEEIVQFRPKKSSKICILLYRRCNKTDRGDT